MCVRLLISEILFSDNSSSLQDTSSEKLPLEPKVDHSAYQLEDGIGSHDDGMMMEFHDGQIAG